MAVQNNVEQQVNNSVKPAKTNMRLLVWAIGLLDEQSIGLECSRSDC